MLYSTSGGRKYASSITSGSPVTAVYPARLERSTGIVNSTKGASGLEYVCAIRKRNRFWPWSPVSTRYKLPASDVVMRRACVRMSSSSVLRSRSVPRATPMRVSSPISRLRFAASDRARAVSMRAAASRYPARTATSSCRGPIGSFTKPESRSDGLPAVRPGAPVLLRGLVFLPAILEQDRLRVKRQGLRRDLPVHPLVRGLSRERRQVGVLHQPSGHRANDVEQVVPLHAVRLDLDDLARLHI